MAILSFVELNPNHNQKSNKDYVNIRYVETRERDVWHTGQIMEIWDP